MDDPRLDELEEMARNPDTDPIKIYDAMNQIGADLTGLQSLVTRFGDSDNQLLSGYLGMTVNHAAWDWGFADERVRDIVVDLVRLVHDRIHAGTTLANTLNALGGLSAGQVLPLDDPETGSLLGHFFLHCLHQQRDFTVPDGCLDLLIQLRADGVLERLLPPSAVMQLRGRLARFAAEAGEQFRADLALLRDFYEPR